MLGRLRAWAGVDEREPVADSMTATKPEPVETTEIPGDESRLTPETHGAALGNGHDPDESDVHVPAPATASSAQVVGVALNAPPIVASAANGASSSDALEAAALPATAPAPRLRDPAARHAQLARFARISQFAAAGIVALLLVAFVGVQIADRGRIRAGVGAFGVDLGGMTREEATAALSEAIAVQSRQTLRLTDGEQVWAISRADLGVRVDIAGAVEDAYAQGRSGWGPSRLSLLWRLRDGATRVGGGRVAIDPAALDAELAAIAAEVQQPKIEAILSIGPDGTLRWVPSQVGRTLDVEASRAAILEALAAGESSGRLVVIEEHPLRTDALYADARRQLENVLDAPIELVAADEVWTLRPDQIAYWLDLVQPQNGQPAQVRINQQWISDIVDEIAAAIDRKPKSARVWWDGSGKLVQTQPGVDGRTLDQAQSEGLILDAFLGRTSTNRVELPVAILNMTRLPDDLSGLGISTMIAEASTPYGGSLAARMHNIELAASKLNGTIIMPGQTFSFNAEIGSTSTDAGFQVAYGIDATGGNVSTVPSVGGGICQVATTVFQPVFWAGYEIVERNTHAYWISRYESRGYVGLDATVDEATGLDFRWTNNTSTAVLMEAVTDGETFTVRLYGALPNWRVEVDPPVITNRRPADGKTHYEPTLDLPEGYTRQVEHAADGFDVSITRRVISGDQVSQAEFIAHYLPARNVVLVGTVDGVLPAEYAALNEGEYTEEPSEYIDAPDTTDEPESTEETAPEAEGESAPADGSGDAPAEESPPSE